MSFVPNAFLFRLALPCPYVESIPNAKGDDLLDLPGQCRIESSAALDGKRTFADVRLAWNDDGLGLQLEVSGKEQPCQGDANRPTLSDGISIWLDTRDARTSHRASRYCHQFHLLATGGGSDGDEPVCVQAKIHRALQDAPFAPAGAVVLRKRNKSNGYRLEAFFPAEALTGFDPEQNRRLGLAYLVRDRELGEEMLGPGSDFPVSEDPSLWTVVELFGKEK